MSKGREHLLASTLTLGEIGEIVVGRKNMLDTETKSQLVTAIVHKLKIAIEHDDMRIQIEERLKRSKVTFDGLLEAADTLANRTIYKSETTKTQPGDPIVSVAYVLLNAPLVIDWATRKQH